jgi:hypothetical protein
MPILRVSQLTPGKLSVHHNSDVHRENSDENKKAIVVTTSTQNHARKVNIPLSASEFSGIYLPALAKDGTITAPPNAIVKLITTGDGESIQLAPTATAALPLLTQREGGGNNQEDINTLQQQPPLYLSLFCSLVLDKGQTGGDGSASSFLGICSANISPSPSSDIDDGNEEDGMVVQWSLSLLPVPVLMEHERLFSELDLGRHYNQPLRLISTQVFHYGRAMKFPSSELLPATGILFIDLGHNNPPTATAVVTSPTVSSTPSSLSGTSSTTSPLNHFNKATVVYQSGCDVVILPRAASKRLQYSPFESSKKNDARHVLHQSAFEYVVKAGRKMPTPADICPRFFSLEGFGGANAIFGRRLVRDGKGKGTRDDAADSIPMRPLLLNMGISLDTCKNLESKGIIAISSALTIPFAVAKECGVESRLQEIKTCSSLCHKNFLDRQWSPDSQWVVRFRQDFSNPSLDRQTFTTLKNVLGLLSDITYPFRVTLNTTPDGVSNNEKPLKCLKCGGDDLKSMDGGASSTKPDAELFVRMHKAAQNCNNLSPFVDCGSNKQGAALQKQQASASSPPMKTPTLGTPSSPHIGIKKKVGDAIVRVVNGHFITDFNFPNGIPCLRHHPTSTAEFKPKRMWIDPTTKTSNSVDTAAASSASLSWKKHCKFSMKLLEKHQKRNITMPPINCQQFYCPNMVFGYPLYKPCPACLDAFKKAATVSSPSPTSGASFVDHHYHHDPDNNNNMGGCVERRDWGDTMISCHDNTTPIDDNWWKRNGLKTAFRGLICDPQNNWRFRKLGNGNRVPRSVSSKSFETMESDSTTTTPQQPQQHGDSSPLTTTNYNIGASSAFPGSSDSLPNVAASNASSCSLVSPHVSLSYTSFPPEISPDESKTIGIVAAVLASTVGQELLEKIRVLQGSDCSIDSIIDRIETYRRDNPTIATSATSLDNCCDEELIKAGIVTEGELVRFYTSVTASDLSIMFTMTECNSSDVFEAGKEVGKKIKDVCEGGSPLTMEESHISSSEWNVVDLTVEMYPFLQLLVWRGTCETERFQAFVVAVGVMDADDKSHKGVSTYIKKERKLREALALHHIGET